LHRGHLIGGLGSEIDVWRQQPIATQASCARHVIKPRYGEQATVQKLPAIVLHEL
jgi:hypothetical protein